MSFAKHVYNSTSESVHMQYRIRYDTDLSLIGFGSTICEIFRWINRGKYTELANIVDDNSSC